MAADYIVKLSGQDNLTETINNVKKSLTDVGKETTHLDTIREKFNKIQNSSAPLKRQLRDLKALMSQMNIDGLSHTEVFEEMAMYAGEVKDAMADANDAISRFADDNFKLAAMSEGFGLITGAVSTATGVLGMFGVENEKVEQTMLKVQSAIAMVNGVQAIATSLNKDSIIMHRIKQIKLAATTAMTQSNTVATVANTAANGANTVSTVANTAATKAWNVAKAVSKALLGDWTGLVLIGATALTAYAICSDKATDADEEKADATKEVEDAQKNYNQTMANTYSQLMTTYTKLKNQWNSLVNEHQKTAWIKENKSQLHSLGIEVNNVADAEKAFNSNTNAVVQSFIRRARAAAQMSKMTELYKKQMELIDKRSQVQTQIKADAAANGRHAKGGDEIKDETFRSSRYGSVGSDGKWRFSQQGAKLYSGTDTSTNVQIQSIDKQIDTLNGEINKLANNIAKDTEKWTPSSTSNGGGKTTHNTTTTKNDTPQPVKGSIGDMEKQLQKLQSDLKNGFITKSAEQQTIDSITNLKEKIEKEKIRLGFEAPKPSDAEKAAEKYKENLKKLQEKQGDIKTTPSQSSYENAIGQNDYNTKTIDGIKNQMDFNDQLIKQLEDLKKAYEDLGMTGETSYQDINEQIGKVQKEQSNLGNSAKGMKDQSDKFDKQKESLQGLADVSSSVGSGFSSLANVFSQTGDSAAAAAMNIIGTTAQATAEIIPNIIKLIGAKQGEAMANGTASASALPFPANIAAIASIIATVVSTFANIMSAVGAFADGGIVGGGNLHGDKVLARLNGGEMVLNRTQQAKLFRTIESGNIGNQSASSVSQVNWKIKGSDLYGVLTNYKSIKSKQGKKI
nr:MAG TPA: Putative tail length tape measure protein [Caudoviricetes sp.]